MRVSTALRMVVGTGGVAMIGFGVWTLWVERMRIGQPASIGRWLVGGVIGHDAILAPAVFLACALAGRFTGPRVRRALALFLLAGGSLLIVGLPDALRSGDNPNPTVTPLDYPRNLTIALGAVAVIAVLSAVPGGLRDRRGRARVEAASEPDSPEPEPELETETETEPDTMPESAPEPTPEPEPQAPPTLPAPPTPPEQASTEQDGDPEDG
jgi:outer membrane biosynthesis protein TonB